MRQCQSIRINDEYHCRSCSLRWSVDDPEPPECGYNTTPSVIPTPRNDVPNSYRAARDGE